MTLSARRWHLTVVLACLVLYLPCTGSYGLWDPWETHYAEVSREIHDNADWFSLTWRGQPGEPPGFWSKPPLTFWAQALGLAAFDLADADGVTLATSTRPEWAIRLPSVLFAVLALWAVFYAASRLLGCRAGVLATTVLATTPLFALIAHQAMTDIYLVGTTTAAMCLVAVALLDDDVELRRGHPLIWLALAVLTATVVPQLVGLARRVPLAQALPYAAGTIVLVIRIARIRQRSHALLHVAFVFAGLAILAKGLLGVGIVIATVGLYLLVTRDLRVLRRLRPIDAVVTLAVVAMPWHHAMYAEHGIAFARELFLYNQWSRIGSGVHGDHTAGLGYFARQLGYGMLPWIPVAIGAVVTAVRPTADRAARFLLLVVIWALVTHGVVAASATKFHHYILPTVVPLAIACGWFLDRCLAGAVPAGARLAMIAIGIPIAALVGWDLVASRGAPASVFSLFTYDYLQGGTPWPPELELRPMLGFAAVAAIGGSCALAFRPRVAIGVLAGAAIVLGIYLQTLAMPAAARAWSQKAAIAKIERLREPGDVTLSAWQFWRGETFYTANELARAHAFVMPFEAGAVAWRRSHPTATVYVLTVGWAREHFERWFPGARIVPTGNPRADIIVVPGR